MNCLRCGEVCHCDPEESSTALRRPRVDANEKLTTADPFPPQVASDSKLSCSNDQESLEGVASPVDAGMGTNDETGAAWRDELTAKLSSYRARRKPRPPRYPSLHLRFEAESSRSAPDNSDPGSFASQNPAGASFAAFESVSDQALALDGMTELPGRAQDEWESASQGRLSQGQSSQSHFSGEGVTPVAPSPRASHGARIIEFPRSAEFARWEPEPPTPSNELAGPVMAPPRILEAPEVVPSAPALGGITIEAAEPTTDHRRLGIDVPLQAAPLARRMAAAAIDGLIVILATALFGLIFWKVAGMRPPLAMVLGLAAGVPCFLWAAYQYLLIVYAATTPGLRLAGLELARFDGTLANRRLRRWRILASYLAEISLGMGYVWVFLDEDALCWHDRITHTYLAPRKK